MKLSDKIRAFDAFAQPVKFNFRGHSAHATVCGGIITLMLYAMSFSVFLGSLNDFYNREESDVAYYDIIDTDGSQIPHNFIENRGGLFVGI